MDSHAVIETTQDRDYIHLRAPDTEAGGETARLYTLKLPRDLVLELAKAQEAITQDGRDLPSWSALEWAGTLAIKLGDVALHAGHARSAAEMYGEDRAPMAIDDQLYMATLNMVALVVGCIDFYEAVRFRLTTDQET